MLLIPNLPEILSWFMNTLFPMYASDHQLFHRGISLSTFLKPFMIIFTFMFARNLTPFSHIFLDVCYVFSGLGIFYGLYFLFKNRPDLRHPLIFSAILPCLFSIFVIEPISLPKMTQLAPQHLIFLFPWLAFIFYQLWNSSTIGRGLNIIFF